ncbi:hypothetical protein CONCODRAFT_5490 [Conidiobolus coronatus NRRL 28638]|uniref:Uncharacterized protein n=1 Tax=Conidiobolus coronatus (strain ATCC 28846 / CBS 209.66 / NRRL 28638) TaxID=796925 RepID=A0A137P9V3_CONC2|nr:hypothetical protein CONCODRAFT_5490 [Conidiobolus coronatus NRRL 28638]|eukprot:KXN71780.1 hypothetical protein CONCODRAFT_5490 [Conidiobolus coronatus NRRL 28638]
MKLFALLIAATLGATINLSTTDNGKSVNARRGDTIYVNLAGDGTYGAPPTLAWSAPVSSDNSILKKLSSSTSANGGASGSFRAGSSGSATITARKACNPQPGKACPMLIQQWQAAINVQGY